MARKRRRSNGEGSIYQVDGKWVAQISYYKDGKLKRPKRICKKHADAVAKLEELRKDALHLDMDEQHHTVESYINEWLFDLENSDRAFSTLKGYRGIVNNYIIPKLGTVKLRELKASKIRRFIHSLQDSGVGSRAVEMSYFCLNSALNQAYKSDIILKNPCVSIQRPVHKQKETIPFTREERELILQAADGDYFYPLYKFMLATGMRSSETFGLHWDDIDYQTRTIHVQRQYIFGDYAKLKSKKSDRFLDLTPGLEEVLRLQREKMNEAGFGDRKYVFCGKRGGHLNSSTFNHQIWKPFLEEAGVTPRGLHHLRHTFASELLAEGADLLVVSALLGHSSPTVTLKIYAHAMPPKRSQVAGLIQTIFG